MNLDSLFCVGATSGMLLSSAIGCDEQPILDEMINAAINGTEEIPAQVCSPSVEIYLTGGETADMGDLVRTIIAGSTVTCHMRRSDIVGNAHITDGDVTVGFASCGQTIHKACHSGGTGSNGPASARHDILPYASAGKFPKSYDPTVPGDLIYSGSRGLLAEVPGTGLTVGELILSPTRIYTPLVAKLLKEIRPAIHGPIHYTGGAQVRVMNFVTNKYTIKDNLLLIPLLFQMIAEESGTDAAEPYQTFNMGHHLEAYLPAEQAKETIATARHSGINAQVISRAEPVEQNRLTLVTPSGTVE